MAGMRRRDFIAAAGSTAVALPFAAKAQQPAMPVIGLLRSTPPAPFAHFDAAVRQGLNNVGFFEGQNVAIEYRNADNQPDRLPALAGDLVRRQVSAIICNGDAAEAARAATTTIPIVFVTAEDPVLQGLVTNLGRPTGNLTGVTFFGGGQLGAKRMELLLDLVPKAAVIAVLMDPRYGGAEADLREADSTARSLGRHVVVAKAASEREFDVAFEKFAEAGAGAILVAGGSIYTSQRQAIVARATRNALPAIYGNRDYVTAGGLISYSASVAAAYRQAGIYAGRILKGAKPGELPILQPTKFELVINLKTAELLGLTVPPTLLVRADEVIE